MESYGQTDGTSTETDGYVPAPFWRRLIARLIDLAICVPLTFACLLVVFPATAILIPFMSDDAWSSFAAFCCYFLAFTLVEYFLLRRRSGQTLGKGLLGLRVVPDSNHSHVDPNLTPTDVSADLSTGQGVSARAALLRMLILIGPLMSVIAVYYLTYDLTTDEPSKTGDTIGTVLLVLWLLVLAGSAVAAVVDRRARRGLHDMAASTRVVRTPRRGIKPREDFKMLVPGRVSMEKQASVVTLKKRGGAQTDPLPVEGPLTHKRL